MERKIWFTSDTHAYHKNIAGPKVSDWGDSRKTRGFDDQYKMTEEIVKQFNKTVGYDDILYHLGDWSFGGLDKVWQFRKQLNVREIHLIYGNHDHNIIVNKRLPNCRLYPQGNESDMLGDGEPEGIYYVGAQRLFNSCQHYKEITIDGQSFVLNHYKQAVWNGVGKGWIHLYGHSHATAEHLVIGKSMDVGIDNAKLLLGEYRPFSLKEVLNLMKNREIQLNDHHDGNSNTR